MQEQEIRKAKRFNYAAIVVVCICAAAVIGLVIWCCNWPMDPYLETDQLESSAAYADLALVGETCYALDGAKELAEICGFDAWTLTEEPEAGEHILTIQLAEEYEFAFYEGGYAKAYFGYGRKFHLDTAWYRVPEEIAGAVAEYIERSGTLQEPALGPGSWFTIDE